MTKTIAIKFTDNNLEVEYGYTLETDQYWTYEKAGRLASQTPVQKQDIPKKYLKILIALARG